MDDVYTNFQEAVADVLVAKTLDAEYYIYDRSGQGAYHRKQHISCSLQYFFDTELYKSEER